MLFFFECSFCRQNLRQKKPRMRSIVGNIPIAFIDSICYSPFMDLNKYLTEVETAASLARKMDITPVLISQWRTGLRPIPLSRCATIEIATNGRVTRKDLRPNDWHKIWPELENKQEKSKVA